ncbi:voltage-gated chloride channel family protein [Ferruginibacter paludis]|uniref:voltage-gated chloride channel family protein n=1 Tax=Ferruginibacter paludis TaxID=1310417 RepID=UPI0025B43D2A|nr:voltage-gated chloride channel family protein [Ferruginibacter paludis]MDN3654733.1 voltage-gated chloride channel family protein [Ferruginibacter paludis]
MNTTKYATAQLHIAKQLLRWTLIIFPVSISIGLLVAFFLWLLDIVTVLRWQHLWLIFLLPLAGILIVWLYNRFGKNSHAGNNLIIDEIHEPGGGVPFRMTPLILFTTIITHLFGGSAGREGTAVQMGGSMASQFADWFKLSVYDKQILLMCGMSAGFAAVFGTPVAGAVFALEVLYIGRIKYDALIPCLIAGIVAHITCVSCSIQHTQYTIAFKSSSDSFFPHISFDLFLLGKVIIAGVLFGFAGFGFAALSHTIKNKSRQFITNPLLVPVVGAVLVVGISYLLGTFDYLGLGVTNPKPDGISIVNAFKTGGAGYLSWFWKLLLTAITLGMGFKGGEVTPLFFIGATLGNILATISGAPVDLMAGLGFIAVFAGATNTPLACTLMGIELFGSENIIYYAVACFTAYYFSGHSGIYKSQRVAVTKLSPVKGNTISPSSSKEDTARHKK